MERLETGTCVLLGVMFASIHSCQRKGLCLIPTAKKQSEEGQDPAVDCGSQGCWIALHKAPSMSSRATQGNFTLENDIGLHD